MEDEIEAALPHIRRFAYSLTGSMPDADDLLQSTVERVLDRGVPEGAHLMKWMFRVCRNLWIDEYRSRRTRTEAAPELKGRDEVDGERTVMGAIAVSEVHSAMQELPEDQRSILALVAIEGRSYREVADILSIPTGTVMSRLARARARLAARLGLDDEGSVLC